jgi:hypothetical protein
MDERYPREMLLYKGSRPNLDGIRNTRTTGQSAEGDLD